MKVAALTPQFVITKVDLAAKADPDGKQETRDGLKRLAEFISHQRRAPEHLKPVAASADLIEIPAHENSHHFTALIIEWSRRVPLNSVAAVMVKELRRREGLRRYKRMQAIKRKRMLTLVQP